MSDYFYSLAYILSAWHLWRMPPETPESARTIRFNLENEENQ